MEHPTGWPAEGRHRWKCEGVKPASVTGDVSHSVFQCLDGFERTPTLNLGEMDLEAVLCGMKSKICNDRTGLPRTPLKLPSRQRKICNGARNNTMTRSDDQAKQEHEDYWQAVSDVADGIVAELEDTDNDDDRDELTTRLVHEVTDQHDCVIRDDLQIQTLQHSNNPCAALFNGTLIGHPFRPTDNFPFAAFAADAFEADVIQKLKGLLGEE
ncbi:MAG: hypothetical protein ACYC0X_19910 [Pirellulaceae bacterium]